MMAYAPSSVLTDTHAAGTGAGAASAASAPIRCIRQCRQEHGPTFTFTPSVTDWTSTLTGSPLPSTRLISVNPEDGSVISRSSVSAPGLAVHRQHAPAPIPA
ncbi:hypothetical protein ACNKHV_04395 [Shigella flexneri]